MEKTREFAVVMCKTQFPSLSAHTCACRYPPLRYRGKKHYSEIDPCMRRGERGGWGVKYVTQTAHQSAHSRPRSGIKRIKGAPKEHTFLSELDNRICG